MMWQRVEMGDRPTVTSVGPLPTFPKDTSITADSSIELAQGFDVLFQFVTSIKYRLTGYSLATQENCDADEAVRPSPIALD